MDYPLWFEHLWRERRRALAACDDLDAAAWRREFGFAAGSLRGMFEHLVETERGWLHDVVLADPAPPPDPEAREADYADPRAALARAEEVERTTRRVLAAFVPARLAETRDATDRDGRPATFTVDQILMHVVTHEMRHHGHVQAMFRLLGRPAPNLDWI